MKFLDMLRAWIAADTPDNYDLGDFLANHAAEIAAVVEIANKVAAFRDPHDIDALELALDALEASE